MKIKKITKRERSSCLGKIKHKSELAAQHHVDELRKIAKKGNLIVYYECQYCDGWHCGNNKED